ncbi:la-related protein 6a [Corythoichthys intestinalis]|uniref:la-related protein 6a n=1 Tax=Corythoichthys intestinalis TaxID=161448 RepID=UPI0025A57351|nr:la-related protein 6a [Corythoichthys intestinalis]XP_061796539.1 la-related protein 6-like [Nerophis lumbriciformis]
MHALVNAFLRCLSFLLPPSWLCVSLCSWASECEETPTRPNPRARFRATKPLTYEEVAAVAAAVHGGGGATAAASSSSPSSQSASPASGCVSPAPQAAPIRIEVARQAVERVWGASRQSSRRAASPPARRLLDSSATDSGEKMSAAASPCSPDSSEEVITVDHRLSQEMGTVTITVAIQAAEDEEPEEFSPGNVDFIGGSCSEDEFGRHDKSSGAGTSGGELEEESWQPPDPELIQKLVTQIEYYLSDENLEHDAFLLKHVRRNKLGFVSVKLLTSFKKVKHLTRDWRTTAFALRQSKLLELNDEGRKVRRKSAVPVFASESLPSRMLLLSELQRWPELARLTENGSGGGESGAAQQEQLMKLLLKAFGTYGAIASVRVLKPGKDLPADLKRLSGRYTQLGTEECAIVEFEEVEAAVKANETVGCEDAASGSPGLKVVLIGTKPPKKKVQKERPGEEAPPTGMRKSRSLNSRVRELQYHADDSACSSSDTESTPTSPRPARKSQSCNKLSPTAAGVAFQNNHLSPRNSPWSSPRASPCAQRKTPHSHKSPLAAQGRLSPEHGRRWADYSSDSSLTPSGSPWVQRRKQVASQESSPVGSPMLGRKIQNADGLPPGVTRLPRGPDGTRGFHCGALAERGKSAATQT